MELINEFIIELLLVIITFTVLVWIGRILYKKIANNKSRFLNPLEYFPDEELTTLRQVFYLIIILLSFIILVYALTFQTSDVMSFTILEILLMGYIAIKLDYSLWKNRILYLLLIPYGSLTYILFNFTLVGYLDLFHLPVLLYIMKVYYGKFKEYTETNGLGITIVLLFTIIFISFIITTISEGGTPLDAIVMVSNAFTSNGYAVLGNTAAGKINSLILVWGGYILSGVGTATLTAAILYRQFNKRFDELENMIKEKNMNEKTNGENEDN